jgi:ATP/maltotriose-dependent transcriptional regulator MalT
MMGGAARSVVECLLVLDPLDDEQRWYRYHQLFADLLRDLQRAQHIDQAELHRRASRWYAQAGLPDEAIQHALTAHDYALAVQLIEHHATDLLMQWQAKTVDDWLRAIPPEWSRHSPRTNLAFAWMHLFRGTFGQVAPYVARLVEIFARSEIEDPSLQAEWLALQATLLNSQGSRRKVWLWPSKHFTLYRSRMPPCAVKSTWRSQGLINSWTITRTPWKPISVSSGTADRRPI